MLPHALRGADLQLRALAEHHERAPVPLPHLESQRTQPIHRRVEVLRHHAHMVHAQEDLPLRRAKLVARHLDPVQTLRHLRGQTLPVLRSNEVLRDERGPDPQTRHAGAEPVVDALRGGRHAPGGHDLAPLPRTQQRLHELRRQHLTREHLHQQRARLLRLQHLRRRPTPRRIRDVPPIACDRHLPTRHRAHHEVRALLHIRDRGRSVLHRPHPEDQARMLLPRPLHQLAELLVREIAAVRPLEAPRPALRHRVDHVATRLQVRVVEDRDESRVDHRGQRLQIGKSCHRDTSLSDFGFGIPDFGLKIPYEYCGSIIGTLELSD